MNELYWITRCDSISSVLTILTISSTIGIVASLAVMLSCYEYSDKKYKDNEYRNTEYRYYHTAKRGFKYSICSIIIGFIGVIFVPTTKEMLMIYGVGNTIDYLKTNEKAKQLPDKVIIALDKYVDNINNDSIK